MRPVPRRAPPLPAHPGHTACALTGQDRHCLISSGASVLTRLAAPQPQPQSRHAVSGFHAYGSKLCGRRSFLTNTDLCSAAMRPTRTPPPPPYAFALFVLCECIHCGLLLPFGWLPAGSSGKRWSEQTLRRDNHEPMPLACRGIFWGFPLAVGGCGCNRGAQARGQCSCRCMRRR